jgi:selenocysteine lyase/cysteine desulfurase
MAVSVAQARKIVSGLEQEVPLLDGSWRRYVNLDNAATTPPFQCVVDHVNSLLEWYSSVHRGTGFKSLLSSHVYERARRVVGEFLGADPAHYAMVFCANTTDAINRLCRCQCLEKDQVVLTTVMEHHSNLLPWRFCGQVDYARISRTDGSLDIEHLESKLREHGGKVKLVTITGASNVTGIIPPIRRIAALVHAHGARLLVDGAQLVPHRPLAMGAPEDPERIDFLVFSGHKMYAPFGSGGLIGPRECFEKATPFPIGGGAVELVTLSEVEWAGVPERQEAGTPNLVGAAALAKAAQTLQEIGMENVAAHERGLTAEALRRFAAIPGLRVYGDADPSLARDRVGVIPVVLEGVHHSLVATALGYEYGIGVRHGCFCAQPYVGRLLGIDDEAMAAYAGQIRAGDRTNLPGFVRVSVGLYNTFEEIAYLADALGEIAARGPRGRYRFDKASGQYQPENFSYDFDAFLSP